jgi:anthranilate/para-aminobenzoate synthase component I
MEIIAELEPDNVGHHAGAVGYFDSPVTWIQPLPNGPWQSRRRVLPQAGGVVADSVPASENHEVSTDEGN